MKKLLFLLSAFLLFSAGIKAQSVPQGMRFQAIARALDGSLLVKKQLSVQVELLSAGEKEKIFYSETHDIQSSDLGLLDFVIGEGTQILGKFSEIPWSTEEMWVRISVKAAGDDKYQIVSSGQLYSVPYALHAASAGSLVGNESDQNGDHNRGNVGNLDQTSSYWTVNGNTNAHNYKTGGPAVIGTTDRTDLTMITNNIARLVIDKNGNINFLFPFFLNGNLNVDGNTTLNGSLDVIGMHPTHLSGTLTVDKSTTLNDSLTVTNMAPTHLTGPLTVDKTMNVIGATTLNSTLDVGGMGATHLTGTLAVDKSATFNSTVTVANMSATNLTGALDVDKTMNVDGASTLNSTLDVTGAKATHLSGTLTEDKTTTLNDSLTVGNSSATHLTGLLQVDGTATVGGKTTLNNTLDVNGMSSTKFDGTLDQDKLATLDAGLSVSGGGTVGPGGTHLAFFDDAEGGSSDGIAVKIANTTDSKENNFMTFYRGNAATVAGRIEGYRFADIEDIPVPTSDEIWTAVCIGIADYNPITILWTQFASGFNIVSDGWNNITIPPFDIPDIPPFVIPDVPAFTIPDVPGFTIPDIPALVVGPYLCGTVCPCPCEDFSFTCCCATVCVVPEFTLFPAITIPDFPGIAIPDFPGIPIPDFPGLVIPSVPAINLKNLFGAAPTIPTFSDILQSQGVCPNADIFNINNGYLRRLADWALANRLQSFISLDPVILAGNAIAWGLTSAVLNNGVVYGSKGADYAEYLPKLYGTEQFMPGDVVGVYNGKISKNTKNADQILAIASQPIVLGNMPGPDDVSGFDKVSFLGQVPVYVKGPVALGDYILPSGKNDGIALAVSAGSLTTDMLTMVLGKAWSEYAGDGVTLINTSIGLRPEEISQALKRQGAIEDGIQQQINLQAKDTELLSKDIDRIKNKLGLSSTTSNP